MRSIAGWLERFKKDIESGLTHGSSNQQYCFPELFFGLEVEKSGNSLGNLSYWDGCSPELPWWNPCLRGLVTAQTSSSPPARELQPGRQGDSPPSPQCCQCSDFPFSFPLSVVQKSLWGLQVFFLLYFSRRHYWKVAKASRRTVDDIFSSGCERAVVFLTSWGSNLGSIQLSSGLSFVTFQFLT